MPWSWGPTTPVGDAGEPARRRWRARFAQFTLGEQGAWVQVEPGDHGYTVSVPEATGELPARDVVEATVVRLPSSHMLHPRLREALACLAEPAAPKWIAIRYDGSG